MACIPLLVIFFLIRRVNNILHAQEQQQWIDPLEIDRAIWKEWRQARHSPQEETPLPNWLLTTPAPFATKFTEEGCIVQDAASKTLNDEGNSNGKENRQD